MRQPIVFALVSVMIMCSGCKKSTIPQPNSQPVAAAASTPTSVSDPSPPQKDEDAWRGSVDAAIRQYGKLPELAEREQTIPATPSAPEVRQLTKHLQHIVLFDRHAGVIWPGALLQGETLTQNQFSPISVRPEDRSPLTITLEGLRGLDKVSRRVDRPDNGSVQEAINALLNQPLPKGQVQPSLLTATFHRIDAFEYSMLKLGIAASWLGSSASTSIKEMTQRLSDKRSHEARW